MPILIVSSALAATALSAMAPPISAPVARKIKRRVTDMRKPRLPNADLARLRLSPGWDGTGSQGLCQPTRTEGAPLGTRNRHFARKIWAHWRTVVQKRRGGRRVRPVWTAIFAGSTIGAV